uniref:Uncharacterized protein n=1 Tax=Arundo donax TaxID=35708 RepID=A0A0A9FCS4_ARUDO
MLKTSSSKPIGHPASVVRYQLGKELALSWRPRFPNPIL